MAAPEPFELNIAILGNSGAGKKTLLDSLVRHGGCSNAQGSLKEGEIGRYTIVPGQEWEDKENGGSAYEVKPDGEGTKVNINDGVELLERSFTVGTAEPIVEMRAEVVLTATIVPPVDHDACENYIAHKWGSWDTIVFVIDGAKGISDEDSKLLKLIKKQNSQDSKEIIVLCNKIDDNESERLGKHAKKAAAKVKKVFGEEVELSDPSSNIFFTSISAAQAYVYRSGSKMTLEEFKKVDNDLVSLVGKEHFGSKPWKKLSDDEKYEKLHEIITESKNFENVLSDCGFNALLSKLDSSIGGENKQKVLIQKKIDKSLNEIKPLQTEWISYSFFAVFGKETRLLRGKENEAELEERSKVFRSKFWELFDKYQEITFEKFSAAFPLRVGWYTPLVTYLTDSINMTGIDHC